MLFKNVIATATALLPLVSAFSGGNKFHHVEERLRQHAKRVYIPKPATGLKTITTPTGVHIRYKEPGEEGVCETTPGVKSYSGYIDIAPNVHAFFWFFESRSNPTEDPFTIWLNGGPGSDSLIGLFQELGPCRITSELKSVLNPYSWNDVSNMLFLSQPVGTGFSYQKEEVGNVDTYAYTFLNKTLAPPTGKYPVLDPIDHGTINTTELAAIGAWHILQGFLSGHRQLGAKIGHGRDFNLWTESYGGHYGPAFYNYFYDQNEKIKSGEIEGYALNFNTLGIGNGIINEAIQIPYYPEFATKNQYGIVAYNQSVYDYAQFAMNWPNGCLAQIQFCEAAAAGIRGGLVPVGNGDKITNLATSFLTVDQICSEAANMCRDNIETLYYVFSGRGTYDIRHPSNDPTPPENFVAYLNQAEIQDALGVSVNYTESNNDIFFLFASTGDFVYPNFLGELENILDNGVRVSLFYGDADYICNWFGGEAVSLALKYKYSKEFAAAGYAPFMVNGVEYGEVREYGNFSFTRIYEAGHEVPYYQPQAALALFNRSINHVDIPTGEKEVTGNLESHGKSKATHTEKAPPLVTATGKVYKSYSLKQVKSYASKDNIPLSAAAVSGSAPASASASASSAAASGSSSAAASSSGM